jgi:quercetin dioxygenase-like cupin family protein
MQVKRALEVAAQPVEGVPGVSIRWLWAAQDGAPTFALRLFEVQPGASTPYHQHAHEHEIFLLEGQASLRGEAGEHPLSAGDTALVPGGEMHQFVNRGAGALRFLCGIPLSGA